MPEIKRFRCLSCGRRFEAETLNEEERREARHNHHPTSPVYCPDCHRTDIRGGWE